MYSRGGIAQLSTRGAYPANYFLPPFEWRVLELNYIREFRITSHIGIGQFFGKSIVHLGKSDDIRESETTSPRLYLNTLCAVVTHHEKGAAYKFAKHGDNHAGS